MISKFSAFLTKFSCTEYILVTPPASDHDHAGALAQEQDHAGNPTQFFFLYKTLYCVCFSNKVLVYRRYSKYCSNTRARGCGDGKLQDHAEVIPSTTPTKEQENVGMESGKIMHV
ncbi:hypothetical protein V6N13_001480 [Hibiscus sabdariffa]